MSDKKKYSYSLGRNSAFIDYMRKQRNAGKCAQFFRDKVTDHSDILDCGCGPGSVTLGLAEWASSGKTIGIDLNGEQLESARQIAKIESITNIEFREANIFELPFEDNQFDIVFAQAIFIHIPDHDKAIKEIRRVLKPGGYAALRDAVTENNLMLPHNPMVTKVTEIYRQGMISSGGDPDVGRSLGSLLLQGEFEDLALSLTWEYSPKNEFRAEYFANMVDVIEYGELGQRAVEQGWIREEERKQIGITCRSLVNDSTAIWGIPFVQALARKP